jgi:hypothetical protein
LLETTTGNLPFYYRIDTKTQQKLWMFRFLNWVWHLNHVRAEYFCYQQASKTGLLLS